MSRLGRVGPYTLLERLGRGGMGEVYLAGSRRGDNVALKVLHDAVDADSDARMRLEREVRALRRVESPYVARVLDADLDGDRPYLVMEHIQGDTLLERVRRDGPLAGGGLLALAHGLATALSVIHAAGVVHRDLKPTNVLVNPGDEPVLIDFGIAHVLDATRLTVTGTFLGTPGYAAPELFADEHVGEPADVHAWAATVTFAATGRPPFGRGPIEAQMYAILNGQADLEGVPAALLPLIRAALHREAAKRPTAALLASRLTRLVRAAPSGVGGAPERRPEGRSRRVRTRVADPARGRAGGVADDAPGTERAIPGREGASRGGRVGTAPEAEPRPGRPSAAAIETSRDGRSSAVAEGARNGRAAPPSGETSRGGRPVTAEGPRAGRTAAGGEAHRGGRSPAAEGEGSRGGRLPAAEGTRGRSASEGKPAGGHRGAREGRTTGVTPRRRAGAGRGPYRPATEPCCCWRCWPFRVSSPRSSGRWRPSPSRGCRPGWHARSGPGTGWSGNAPRPGCG